MFRASDYSNLLQQIEQFFTDSANQKPIAKRLDPEILREQLSLDLPMEGKSLEQLQTDIAQYLTYGVKTAHPQYFNQLWGGFSSPCFMGDILTSATNTSMYTYEVAPVATLIEKTLVAKMGKLVGFSEPEGQFTTGGSNGNFMAMAIARHRAIPSLKQEGMVNSPKLIAFVSADAHYSFAKAAHLLGLGTNQLWKVPVDKQGRMVVAELEKQIAQACAQGAQPFFVAGTAGTTVQGAYDPFGEIATVAHREGLWFHVDGAWGASVLLSPTHRNLMQGVEQADSVVWDAHKMMGMTLMCSVLLLKHRGMMLSTFSADGTDYLFHAGEEEPIDLGLSSIHCGRRVDAVKLWLTWKQLGDRGWETLIDQYFTLAAYAEAIINAHESLVMVTPRQSLNLCFQYIPQNSQQDPNTLTLKIRQALWEEGVAMVNYAQLDNRMVFRLVICNNQTSQSDIKAFFETLVGIGQRLEQEIGGS
ncbi:MAG: aminotransferase class V-fold PLP-dependent enzyme [Symploca sp. SIO1B1]|nr:aminotransferase class V-fold PLP-dependent enzyme [Symploca sp. SIO1C2]NER93959.1 aminotransferase class V-fold PLP-dependent enzyme [Symploca sp. SIO1B1]